METLRTLFLGSTKDSDQVVTKATTHLLHPELHNSAKLSQRLSLFCDITEVGSKSFVRRIQLFDETASEPLITSLVKRVNSDRKTQMPLPLNPDFKEKCMKYITSLGEVEKDKVSPFPFIESVGDGEQSTFSHNVTVCHSDIDVLFHTNQASYLKYCLDAAAVAVDNGKFKNFINEMSFYPCKYTESLYFKQTFANDPLTVHIYENEPEEKTLRFKILNSKSELVFYSLMNFYPV